MTEPRMGRGAKATWALVLAAFGWDLTCRDGETISETLAGWLANRVTRGPLAAILVLLAIHLLVLARRIVVAQPIPLGSPGNLGLERYEGLRAIGFPA